MRLLLPIFPVMGRGFRRLSFQGFPVLHAAPEEFRPGWHGNLRLDPLGQQAPELRMVPAKVMAATIPVLPDTGPEALHLGDQFVPALLQKIVVQHRSDLS